LLIFRLEGISKVAKNHESVNLKKQQIEEKDVKEFVIERFENVKTTNKIKDLVSFQAMNKYMIMAHSQEELKILGNLVGSNKKIKFSEILNEYEKHLKKALEKEPTTKTHSNVILHIFGYFSQNFNQHEKEQFFELLSEFKEEKITISEILSSINPIVYRFDNTYLASQTYFLLYSDPHSDNSFEILMKN
jgi:uncharacterized protein YbgA (DUF1722 family)